MNNIILATAANENYAPGLLVMVASVLASLNPTTSIKIHFFNGGLAKQSMKNLERICRSLHPRCSLVNTPFNESVFAGSTVGPANSYMCYTRLLLGSMINSEKVIYIDSDILVLKDLTEAWEMDMQGKISLVCQDAVISQLSHDCPWPLEEQCKAKTYFNSGFMVIDLNRWREKSIECESLKLAKSSTCKFFDQTILNYVLRADVLFINADWNWQSDSEPDAGPLPLKNYHFVHGLKPWSYYRHGLRWKLWRYFYSTFVGSTALHLLSKGEFRKVLAWCKDYLVRTSATYAWLYEGYIRAVYGVNNVNASTRSGLSNAGSKLTQVSQLDKESFELVKSEIKLRGY